MAPPPAVAFEPTMPPPSPSAPEPEPEPPATLLLEDEPLEEPPPAPTLQIPDLLEKTSPGLRARSMDLMDSTMPQHRSGSSSPVPLTSETESESTEITPDADSDLAAMFMESTHSNEIPVAPSFGSTEEDHFVRRLREFRMKRRGKSRTFAER